MQAWIGGSEFNWSFPRHARLYVAILSLEESGWIASYNGEPRAVKIPDSQKRKYAGYVESNNWTVDAAFLAANKVTRETLASSLARFWTPSCVSRHGSSRASKMRSMVHLRMTA